MAATDMSSVFHPTELLLHGMLQFQASLDQLMISGFKDKHAGNIKQNHTDTYGKICIYKSFYIHLSQLPFTILFRFLSNVPASYHRIALTVHDK